MILHVFTALIEAEARGSKLQRIWLVKALSRNRQWSQVQASQPHPKQVDLYFTIRYSSSQITEKSFSHNVSRNYCSIFLGVAVIMSPSGRWTVHEQQWLGNVIWGSKSCYAGEHPANKRKYSTLVTRAAMKEVPAWRTSGTGSGITTFKPEPRTRIYNAK
jgi:hypothetical protein